MVPFYGWASIIKDTDWQETVYYQETVYSLLVSPPGVPGTNLFDLRKMKDWVYIKEIQWF